MKVIVAKELGFCDGVRRALHMLDLEMGKDDGKPLYTIGEIIHNKDVIAHYKERGVGIIETIDEIDGGRGVVRAHGLPQSVINSGKEAGKNIIDATCPYVRRLSNLIKRAIREGQKVFFFGEPEHPEVIAATHDYIDSVTIVDYRSFNAATFHYPTGSVALLAQTTLSVARFDEITVAFAEHCQEMTVYNTICPSTRNRQTAALEAAKLSDCMIVLGGKNSSNTKRLYELCKEIVPSFHVERIAELDLSKLQSYRTVAVTAGASTPDWIVQEAVTALEKL